MQDASTPDFGVSDDACSESTLLWAVYFVVLPAAGALAACRFSRFANCHDEPMGVRPGFVAGKTAANAANAIRLIKSTRRSRPVPKPRKTGS